MISFGQNLEVSKSQAQEEILEKTNNLRRLFISGLLGQDMIYLEKKKEADLFLAQDPTPTDLTDYTTIENEVGVTATTAYEVAQVISNRGAMWKAARLAMEKSRYVAQDGIKNASTRIEIQDALAVLKTSYAEISNYV